MNEMIAIADRTGWDESNEKWEHEIPRGFTDAYTQ